MDHHSALVLEFLLLSMVLPLLYRFASSPIPALPALWLVTANACTRLCMDARFYRSRLWNFHAMGSQLPSILLIFAVVAAVIWLGAHHFAPELEWK